MKPATLLFVAFFSILSPGLEAQDPAFSGYRTNVLQVNPGFAGTWACARAEADYRLQWPKLSAGYRTFAASYDQLFRFGGLGLSFLRDNAGSIYYTSRIDLSFSHGFTIGRAEQPKLVIQPGLQLGIASGRVDLDKLTYGSMIDPTTGQVISAGPQLLVSGMSNLDMSAGVLIYNQRFAAGISCYHLFEPNFGIIGISALPRRFVLHAATVIGHTDEDETLRIVPSVMYSYQQPFMQLKTTLTASLKGYSFGIGYRNKSTVSVSAGYRLEQFSFYYLFEFPFGKMDTKSGGTHELGITWALFTGRWQDETISLRNFN